MGFYRKFVTLQLLTKKDKLGDYLENALSTARKNGSSDIEVLLLKEGGINLVGEEKRFLK